MSPEGEKPFYDSTTGYWHYRGFLIAEFPGRPGLGDWDFWETPYERDTSVEGNAATLTEAVRKIDKFDRVLS